MKKIHPNKIKTGQIYLQIGKHTILIKQRVKPTSHLRKGDTPRIWGKILYKSMDKSPFTNNVGDITYMKHCNGTFYLLEEEEECTEEGMKKIIFAEVI